MIGQTISHYKILAKLGEACPAAGQGRHGRGLQSRGHQAQSRCGGIKFLPCRRAHVEPSSIMASEVEKARFIHEAQAAAALNHPNICTIYEINEIDGQAFIAIEFIEGQSLQEKIKSAPLTLVVNGEAAVRRKRSSVFLNNDGNVFGSLPRILK